MCSAYSLLFKLHCGLSIPPKIDDHRATRLSKRGVLLCDCQPRVSLETEPTRWGDRVLRPLCVEVVQVRRLIDIAILDTLALDNTVNRNRTLAYLAQTAVKLLDVGEHEELLERIDS